MRYTLLLHYPEMTAEELGEDALEEGMAAFDAYAKALDDAGVLLSAEVLAPSAATTTISGKSGDLRVQDGPFAGASRAGRRQAGSLMRAKPGRGPSGGNA